MVTVSVLIPAFNAAPFIRRSVSSALAQKGVACEVIVIDDGSTDDTRQILTTEFGSSIRILTQKNSGHSRARNNGAEIAKGEWLAFLDADDEWLPNKLTRQLSESDAKDLVYTERENFGEIDRVSSRQRVSNVSDVDIFQRLLCDGNFITVSSVIIRKGIFKELKGFAEDLYGCDDWDLWLRVAAMGGRIGICQEPLTRYRWHGGAMTNNLDRMLQGRLKVLERALSSPRGQRLPWAVRRQATARVWEISAWYAAQPVPSKALRWYTRSALCWPWKTSVYRAMIKCFLGVA